MAHSSAVGPLELPVDPCVPSLVALVVAFVVPVSAVSPPFSLLGGASLLLPSIVIVGSNRVVTGNGDVSGGGGGGGDWTGNEVRRFPVALGCT